MKTTITKLLQDESGATAIEYGLIAALVSVAAIGALTAMGDSLNAMADQRIRLPHDLHVPPQNLQWVRTSGPQFPTKPVPRFRRARRGRGRSPGPERPI